ncbi:uncharacterized protein V1518DRAFT_413560 [Limtongia smithiae]|uniref:uncharacterized protein n=1 Tax=Limtongia smithiae TaxID=1125753 RepID=UPI0034CF4055
MDISLHVLPNGSLLLCDEATIHFLAPATLRPQRNPAVFDSLAAVVPRPQQHASSQQASFACVQTTPALAVSVWRYTVAAVGDDLECTRPRMVVSSEYKADGLADPVCCWDLAGAAMVFGLPTGRIVLVDFSDEKDLVLETATPDQTAPVAIAPSPHDSSIYAIACASGNSYLCKLIPTAEASGIVLNMEVLHAIPAGPTADGDRTYLVADVAFHPTSSDPDTLMLAVWLRPAEENEVIDNESNPDEIQLWCINLGRSVNLIRRLRAGKFARNRIVADRLRWSKNGRVVQPMANALVIYDVRRNNGTQEAIYTPPGTRIVAMEILRDSGVAWVLDSSMDLHVYDLLHGTQYVQVNVGSRRRSYSVDSARTSTGSPNITSHQQTRTDTPLSEPVKSVPEEAEPEKQLQQPLLRKKSSTDLLSYYFDQLSAGLDKAHVTTIVGNEMEKTAIYDDMSDVRQGPREGSAPSKTRDYLGVSLPATAIATSPIWMFTDTFDGSEDQLRDEESTESAVLPLTPPLPHPTLPETDLDAAVIDSILPDCLFSNLGELMQTSELDLVISAVATARDFTSVVIGLLFGWEAKTSPATGRDVIKWELDNTSEEPFEPYTVFLKLILSIWLQESAPAGSDKAQADVEQFKAILEMLQLYASTRAMTVSVSWLVFAMQLVGTKVGNESEKQQTVRAFVDKVLFKDVEGYGDDVEAVHLAAAMMIGSGMVAAARDVYADNAYFIEAAVLSVTFGLPMDEVLTRWAQHAESSGTERIQQRCRRALQFIVESGDTAPREKRLEPAPRLVGSLTPSSTVSELGTVKTHESGMSWFTESPARSADSNKTSPPRRRRPDLSIQLFREGEEPPVLLAPATEQRRPFPKRADSLRGRPTRGGREGVRLGVGARYDEWVRLGDQGAEREAGARLATIMGSSSMTRERTIINSTREGENARMAATAAVNGTGGKRDEDHDARNSMCSEAGGADEAEGGAGGGGVARRVQAFVGINGDGDHGSGGAKGDSEPAEDSKRTSAGETPKCGVGAVQGSSRDRATSALPAPLGGSGISSPAQDTAPAASEDTAAPIERRPTLLRAGMKFLHRGAASISATTGAEETGAGAGKTRSGGGHSRTTSKSKESNSLWRRLGSGTSATGSSGGGGGGGSRLGRFRSSSGKQQGAEVGGGGEAANRHRSPPPKTARRRQHDERRRLSTVAFQRAVAG